MTPLVSSRRAAAVLLTAAMAFGCSDSSTGPASRGPQGTYSLRRVAQKGVPTEIHHGPWFDPTAHHFYNQLVVTVTGGAVELSSNGSFAVWIEYDVVADGTPGTKRVTVKGTYDVTGSQVILYVDGAGSERITVQDGEIVEPIDLMQEGRLLDYSFKK